MRIARLLLVLAALLAFTGCSCRSKKVGPGDENVPVVDAGSALKDVHFAFDSFALSDEAKTVLKENSAWLNANTSVKTQVEGHCDERGTNEYNMALGAKRARAVYDFVRSLGVDAARLSTVSYGKELPLDPAHNEAAWAKNRRGHFNVQK